MSGYELTQFFDSAAGWVWSAPQSQIYPLLKQMERDGFVTGDVQVKGARLKRTVYSVTDTGLAELRDWLATPHPSPAQREPFFLQALFFDMIEAEDAATVLAEFIAEQESMIEQWTRHRDLLLTKDTRLLRERLKDRPADQHERIAALKAHVFDGQIAVAQARLDWARHGLDLLRSETVPDTSRREG